MLFTMFCFPPNANKESSADHTHNLRNDQAETNKTRRWKKKTRRSG